jgi:glucosamine--fructose-6-phosphate aminotransferase (isomerizing)
MMETAEVVRQFNPDQTIDVAEKIKFINWLLLTGEGSSRIFPAKNTIRKAHTWGMDLNIITEGSSQAMFYDLSKFAVFCASNSGRTKEVISLTRKQQEIGNKNIFGLTANFETMLERTCNETFVLKCGWEKAVAATKSVIEQAMFYESILWNIIKNKSVFEPLGLSMKIEQALTMNINSSIIEDAVKAPIIYFAGYNDGVAEELTLKTNEITRKKSDYLEGTYAVHGIEEVLDKEDIVFLVDPIDEEIEKFQKVLVDGVGLKVVAIASRETPFTTIRIPDAGVMNPYVFLCAGWNLLVEIGLAAGIDLDKPKRARKVGNEFAF